MTESPSLGTFEREVLDAVQKAIPLVDRPFADLAARLGSTEAAVIDSVARLKNEARIIRQISAIFDTRALGYQSTLVAARYDEDAVDQAAEVINTHPGVSHNYRRRHAYNLWYTLAVPPDSRLGLDGTLARLHEISGAAATRRMQTLRLFKIGVRLDVKGDRAPDTRDEPPAYDEGDQREACSHPLTAEDIEAIRLLQRDLPLVPAPFEATAAEAGRDAAWLLAAATRLLHRKQMRRLAAVLRHREAGFGHNCMVVWDAADDRAEEAGRIMAGFDAVSHCYRRPRFEDWPYNLFTMIHGRTREECLAVADAIAKASGVSRRAELWTVKEYKKARVRYFTPDAAAWEERYGGQAPAPETSGSG